MKWGHNHKGLVESKVRRQTGQRVSIYRADEAGMDPNGGPWVTLCEEHGCLVNHEKLAFARAWATCPLSWCEECQSLWSGDKNP